VTDPFADLVSSGETSVTLGGMAEPLDRATPGSAVLLQFRVESNHINQLVRGSATFWSLALPAFYGLKFPLDFGRFTL
jgi:hypothetical protein